MPSHRIRFKRTDIWREGKWLDLWSAVHFLSGVSVALILSRFHFDFLASTIIAFLLLVGYELWEAMVKIVETPQNRVMDVVVGMTSFLMIDGSGLNELTGRSFFVFAAFVIGFNIIFATFGWYASQKAAALEARVKQRIEERRRRFIERRLRRAQQKNKEPFAGEAPHDINP